jgi:hypothetical protein
MGSQRSERRAEELGRMAARLLRRGRPAVEKAVAQSRPKLEKAAQDAWRYAQEHEDEIKRHALRAARLKVRGPFGFVIDAVSSGLRDEPSSKVALDCSDCGFSNSPNARFCSSCGTALTESP